VWPFIFLAIMILLAVLLALVELVHDIWTNKRPTTETKGAILARKLKVAFCGCCMKKPPPPGMESRETQTADSRQTQTILP
jgi:hypothetical protein